MVSTVYSGVDTDATGYGNQRKTLWASNGNAIATFKASGIACLEVSTDGGNTWSAVTNIQAGGNAVNCNDFTASIDQDDYIHAVFKNSATAGLTAGYIYYVRGTPNAGRTGWTWSAAQLVGASTGYDYPDVVAFRDPAGGGGWVVWGVFSYAVSGNSQTGYFKITISSGGVFTISNAGTGLGAATTLGTHTYPSIDFQHTGDGKTPVVNPSLFVVWVNQATGAGNGLRYIKATYSAGTWTWQAEKSISTTSYVVNSDRWFTCLFDGTRVIAGGRTYDGTTNYWLLFDIDPATDTVTNRINDTSYTTYSYGGSMSYAANGDVYFVGGTANLYSVHWVRSSASWSVTTIRAKTNTGYSFCCLSRGRSSNILGFMYVDGNAAPYTVKFDTLTTTVTVVKNFTIKWNDLVKVQKNFTAKWNYPVRVVKNFSTIFSVLIRVVTQESFPWNVIRHTDWTRVSAPTDDTYKRVDL